jgi:hypothetical protein
MGRHLFRGAVISACHGVFVFKVVANVADFRLRFAVGREELLTGLLTVEPGAGSVFDKLFA